MELRRADAGTVGTAPVQSSPRCRRSVCMTGRLRSPPCLVSKLARCRPRLAFATRSRRSLPVRLRNDYSRECDATRRKLGKQAHAAAMAAAAKPQRWNGRGASVSAAAPTSWRALRRRRQTLTGSSPAFQPGRRIVGAVIRCWVSGGECSAAWASPPWRRCHMFPALRRPLIPAVA